MPRGRADGRTVLRVVCTRGQAELVADRLLQCGASAVVEETLTEGTGIAEAVVLTGDVATGHLESFRLWSDSVAPAVVIEFPEVDPGWADAWREHAEAVLAGPFLVRPPWVDADSLRSGPECHGSGRWSPIELVVDPGRVFGSGSHPTTRMCLEAIGDLAASQAADTVPERAGRPALPRLRPQCSVADVGCGSGVLAVGALLAGAHSAVGVDTDPAAGEVSRAVALANGVGGRYEFRPGGMASLRRSGERFDMVVANLLIPVIEELGCDIEAICRPGGVVVVSGLLVDQRDRCLVALDSSVLLREYRSDGWLTLVLTDRTAGRGSGVW